MISPLRYPGGKAKVVQQILNHFPKKFDEFREPCVGGGSVFLQVAQQGLCDRIWISDIHYGLMKFWDALKQRPSEFISMCKAILPMQPGEPVGPVGPNGGAPKNARLQSLFDSVKLDEDCDQAFRYFVVNRMVHGSGRVNYLLPSRLYYSNPEGWNIVKTNRLENAADLMKNVRVSCFSYHELLCDYCRPTHPDVLIYLDPPYVINTGLSRMSQLYQYNFTRNNHLDLAKEVWDCKHKVIMSYDDDKGGLIRALYPSSKFNIVETGWAYTGTSSKKKRVGKELLIMNY
jgi:DNA adenine methylase